MNKGVINTMKRLKLLFIVALIAGTAMAQNRVMSGATWNIGLPTGSMSDFMNKTSWGGFGFEARNFVSDEWSFGGSLSWNYWSEKTGDIIPLKNGALSGTQIRYVNSFPIYVNTHFFMGDRKDEFRPFLGLNVGAIYFLQRLDMGVYSLNNDHWHFAMAPEGGFLLQVDRDTFLSFTGRYNYAFSSGEGVSRDKNDQAYWGLNVGFFWMTSWF